MIRCLIVEDEPLAQKAMRKHIEEHPSLTLLGVASDVFEAQAIVEKNKPDLIFLDINLPQVTGTDWLRSMGGHPVNVVITSGQELGAVEAFDLNVIHCLPKPITLPKVMEAVNRYRQRTQKQIAPDQAFLWVKQGRGDSVRVFHRDIQYLEAQDGYVKICLAGKKSLLISATLKMLDEKLPTPPFFQMNRTFIVRHDCVERVNGSQLTLCDEQTITVSPSYQNNLEELLKLFESNG